MLAHIKYAINQTPNRTTGYWAFYLNYGYHPLNPIQMLEKHTILPMKQYSNSSVECRPILAMQYSNCIGQKNKCDKQQTNIGRWGI